MCFFLVGLHFASDNKYIFSALKHYIYFVMVINNLKVDEVHFTLCYFDL